MANSKDNISTYATSFIGFDEQSGSAMDSIGGWTGTLYNNPQRVDGWNGYGHAMSFNGSNNFIYFDNKIPLGATSIRFKIKTGQIARGDILATCEGTTGVGVVINIMDGNLKIYYCKGTTNAESNFTLESKIKINDNNWHDILFTWDGTTNSNTAKLYIDDMVNPNATLTATKEETQKTLSQHNLMIGDKRSISNLTRPFMPFNGQLDSIEIYNMVISGISDKYLVQHNGQYKYHDDTSWQITTNTEENFIQYGMSQLSQITEQQWQELSGEKSLAMWSDFEYKKYMNVVYNVDQYIIKDKLEDNFKVELQRTSTKGQKMKIKAPAEPQSVYANGDISLIGVETVDSINLLYQGNPKTAISFDSGATYKAFKNNSWITITDIADGMTPVELNSLTSEQLTQGKGSSVTARIAYHLSGLDEVDNIQIRVSMQGREELAKQSDYTMSYDMANKQIIFDIKKNGTYSVNFVNSR